MPVSTIDASFCRLAAEVPDRSRPIGVAQTDAVLSAGPSAKPIADKKYYGVRGFDGVVDYVRRGIEAALETIADANGPVVAKEDVFTELGGEGGTHAA